MDHHADCSVRNPAITQQIMSGFCKLAITMQVSHHHALCDILNGIFHRKEITVKTSFFSLQRYKILGNDDILLSIQGSTSGKLQPNPTKRYDTVGAVDPDFDLAFTLHRKFIFFSFFSFTLS